MAMIEDASNDRLERGYRVFGSAIACTVYIFLIVPSLIVIPISFGDKNDIIFPPTSFSIYLYRQFLFESNWMVATGQSLRVAIGCSLLALLIGVPAAYGLVRGRFPGKRLVNFLLLSPILVPVIVIALGLYLYFGSLGLTGTTTGLILAHTVYTTPFVVITVSAGLKHLDPNLETAAAIMGAGRWRILLRVILPQLMPAVLAGVLFAFLISFDEVVLAWFISSAATTTLPVKMYSSIQWEISPVIAAVSTLLTLLSLIVCIATALAQRSR